MYTRLIPVLPVGDVLAERGFYEALGFRRHMDPDEQYPEAAFAALEFGPTLELKVSFLRAARPGRIVGEARVVHRTRSIAFLEGRLFDAAGEPVAAATSTVRIQRLSPEAFAR